MGHSLCSFILRQIPRRSPTHNAVYFTTTRLGGYNNVDRLSQFLEEHIYSIDGVKSIQSHLLIRQYKTNSYLARYRDED